MPTLITRMPSLVGATLVLVAGWLSAFGYVLWTQHDDALRFSQATAQIHARNLEEHLTQALQAIELAASSTVLGAEGAGSQPALRGQLIDVLRPTPFLRSLSVLQANGRIVASSNGRNVGVEIDIDRFYPFADRTAQVLRVGMPWRGRDFDSGAPLTAGAPMPADEPFLIPVLRRLPGDAEGLWLLVALNPDYFINHAAQLIAPELGHVQWLRYDDVLLMSGRLREDPGQRGSAGALGPWLQRAESGALEQALPDGTQVQTAYRASSRFPLVVAVHLDRQAALADWRLQSRRLAAVVVPTLLLLLASAWLAGRRRLRHEQRRLAASVFEGSSDAFLITTPDARVLSVNAAFQRVTGHRQRALQGQPLEQLAAGTPSQGALAKLWPGLVQTGRWQGQLHLRHAQGHCLLVSLSLDAVLDDSGRLNHFAGTLVDITERQAVQERLQLAASVFSHVREGILITAPDGTVIDTNDAFSHITGYSREEVCGRNPRMLGSGKHDAAFYAALWAQLLSQGHWTGEIWNRRKTGETYVQLLTISAVRDDLGRVLRYVGLFSDISQQKEHEQRLQRVAHHDSLTGLPNRLLLADRLRQAMVNAQRRSESLAVVFLDLDGFKAVNDEHGHAMGDQLLIALAARMADKLRSGDTLARLGGDEFVALLIDLHEPAAALPVLERLRLAVAQPLQLQGHTLQVSASLGVSFFPQPGAVDADQLLRQADRAMYRGKSSGKDRVELFDPERDRDLGGPR